MPGLGLREVCGIDSAVRRVIVCDIGLGYTQWLCCQQEFGKPCRMVIAISAESARVVGHHSAAAEEEREARIRWHWQTETYASLVTMRSCQCGIVDALMARCERSRRRKHRPYISDSLPITSQSILLLIRALTDALRIVISVVDGIHRAIQKTRSISTADRTVFVSDIQSRTRLHATKRAIEWRQRCSIIISSLER